MPSAKRRWPWSRRVSSNKLVSPSTAKQFVEPDAGQRAEAERRRELHRARELDALRLDAARGEVAARHLGILGSDAHVAPAPGIVAARHLDRLGDRQPALADAEVDRRVDLRIVEFHQHVGTGDAKMGRAECHESRNVERAHADDVEIGMVGREAQQARVGVGERRFRLDAGPRQYRRGLLQDPALGQGQDQLFVRFTVHGITRPDGRASTGWAKAPRRPPNGMQSGRFPAAWRGRRRSAG